MIKTHKSEAINITMEAIERTSEFKYIIERIKNRASLGYNYLKVEDDEILINYLNNYSIIEYLESLGFIVGQTKITWEFNND